MAEITLAFLQQAIAGDRRALRTLLATMTPVVQARVARALLRGRDRSRDVRQEVEDLTQHVFLTLFADEARALKQWDPGRGLSFANFVGLIAEREVCTVLRSRKKSPWTEEPTEAEDFDQSPDSSQGPERLVASREALSAIHKTLRERLTDRGLEMFHLLYIEARASDEVCAIMEMTPEAVYAWRSRLGRLIQEIAAEIVSDPSAPTRKPLQRAP